MNGTSLLNMLLQRVSLKVWMVFNIKVQRVFLNTIVRRVWLKEWIILIVMMNMVSPKALMVLNLMVPNI